MMRQSLSALLFVVVGSSPVAAQGPSPADIAQARELFQMGVERLNVRDWAGACDSFDQSLALVETAETHFNMAVCAGELGRVLDQSEHLRAYVRLVGGGGDTERVADANLTLERLAQRIPKVVIRVPERAAPGLRIRIGEHEIPRQAWGVPRPVNPGAIAIEAAGGGYISYHQTLQVREGETVDVEISLVVDPAHGERVGMTDTPPEEEGGNEWLIWTGVGVGVAGVGVALLLLLTQGGEDQAVPPEFPPGTVVFEALTAE
jgi:hypothetical protein